MKLSRDRIQRMVKTNGLPTVGKSGGSGAGGGGGVSATWVDDNYISKAFFSKLFKAYNGSTLVEPNDTESTINNIKAMFGFWTEQYISALGQNSGGGGGGTDLNEPLASINDAGLAPNPTSAGQTIVWNGSAWVYGTTGGSVTSVGLEAPTGLAVSGSPITSSGTLTLSYATGYAIPLTADVNKGVTAYGWGNHATQGYLTGITAAMINSALGFTLSGTAGSTYNLSAITSNISTLQGYFDANGNARNALRLTTISKTAWGQTFWTSGGVPTNISGDMSDVGNISMNGSIDFYYYGFTSNYTSRIIERANGLLELYNNAKVDGYLQIGDARLVWESANNALKLIKSDGTATNFYSTGGLSGLGLSAGSAGSIDNLTVNSYLYIKTTDNYLHINLSTLQIKSGGTITLNDNCSVNAAGNTLTVANVSGTNISGTNISGTNLTANKETIGTSLTAATIEIYHNGTKYYFNKAAAVSAGILTTSNG